MVQFISDILKFREQGEKTGWTYVEVPAVAIRKLKPGFKKSFRVKGKLDGFTIKGVALLPMGGGRFIMPINAAMRKGTGKRYGDKLHLDLEADDSGLKLNAELMICLAEEPSALKFFKQFPKSQQGYFSKWIDCAKTEPTKVKRIALSVNALLRGQNYPEMIRGLRNK